MVKISFSALVLALLVLPLAPAHAANQEASTTSLAVSGVAVSHIGASGAIVSWRTNAAASSQVFYDTVSRNSINDYALQTAVAPGPVLAHSLPLNGLNPGITYYYRVKSVLTAGSTEFVAISGEYTFTTTIGSGGGGGIVPPSPPPGTTDIRGVVTAAGRFTGPVIIVSEDLVATLTIPEGTVGLTRDLEPLAEITVVEMAEPPAPPAQANVIGLIYNYGPDGAIFDTPLTLTLDYDPEMVAADITEEELVIAYYDKETGQWVELESTVDTRNKTVTAFITHFTAFTVLGYGGAALPSTPASFTVDSLEVSPGQVYPGDRVNIVAVVTNTGGEAASYSVTLKIDGVTKAAREITVDGGRSKEAHFSVTGDAPGVYVATVEGLSGSFEVVTPPPAPAAFSLSDLTIEPAEVQPGETVNIAASVLNTGGMEGSYTVVLVINGVKEAEEKVTVAAGGTRAVGFSVAREAAGDYSVSVDGLSGSFSVAATLPVKPAAGWLLAGAIAVVVVLIGLLVLFLVGRRAR